MFNDAIYVRVLVIVVKGTDENSSTSEHYISFRDDETCCYEYPSHPNAHWFCVKKTGPRTVFTNSWLVHPTRFHLDRCLSVAHAYYYPTLVKFSVYEEFLFRILVNRNKNNGVDLTCALFTDISRVRSYISPESSHYINVQIYKWP